MFLGEGRIIMVHQQQNRIGDWAACLGTATLGLIVVFVLAVVASQAAQAQTFKVIHNFSGGQDGANPYAGVTLDKAGNLYGTAYAGGIGHGTVYQLKKKPSGWIFNPLYSFPGGIDGANPLARVILGRNGTLYGTTYNGGTSGVGTVFNLKPSASACKSALCPWTETVLYSFPSGAGGAYPEYGDLLFDQAGDIYGTAADGGYGGFGVVYELTPSGPPWTENILYSFSGSDGEYPANGVIPDSAGNLYGTTYQGGLSGYGTVFELMPSGGFPWIQCTLNNFNGSNGAYVYAGLIADPSGNLYGATTAYGKNGGGTVFQLTYSDVCTWTLTTLYNFTNTSGSQCGPWGTLAIDGDGNIYGATYCDGTHKAGNVFKLAHNTWVYTSLYDFTGGNDGGNPVGQVIVDANGTTLYGTTSAGGTQNVGVIWEITIP